MPGLVALKMKPPRVVRKRPPKMPGGPPSVGARFPKPVKKTQMAPVAKRYAARARREYGNAAS